jgi:hypothetical protein
MVTVAREQVVAPLHPHRGQRGMRHLVAGLDEREPVHSVLVHGRVHLPHLGLDLAERGFGQLPVQGDGEKQPLSAGVVHLRALSAHRKPPAAEVVEQRSHPRRRAPRHHQVLCTDRGGPFQCGP